jgi:type II secretory pathway component GspD/PulD (secretin)
MLLNPSGETREAPETESLAAGGGPPARAEHYWEGNQLIVRAPVRVHDELAKLLDAWQTSGMAQICIECRMLTSTRELATATGIEWKSIGAAPAIHDEELAPSRLQSGTVVRASAQVEDHLPIFFVPLNGRQVQSITQAAQSDSRGSLMFAPKVTLFNGQQAVVADLVKRPFVVGLEKQPDRAIKPRVQIVDEGTKITLRTVLQEDRKNIRLTGRIDLANIIDVGFVSAFAEGENLSIQVPRVRKCRISVASEIEDGQSLLIGCLPRFDRKDFFYVLLTVRHIVVPMGN